MIKFSMKKGKKNILGLGLSMKNIDYLLKDKPISVDVNEIGMGHVDEIIIFTGKTEQSILDDMKDLIGTKTKIKTYESKSNG